MLDSGQRLQLLKGALNMMSEFGPRPLAQGIQTCDQMAGYNHTEADIKNLWKDILSDNPNSAAKLIMGKYLRRWDAARTPPWSDDTDSLSNTRRDLIYRLLEIEPEMQAELNKLLPVADLSAYPVVIAEDHEEWYTPERRASRSFYWDAYSVYLDSHGWPDESIHRLDEASTLIVERLSDPERGEIYATKGLVVGYVQSGKTANFTAVAAKAADAGYRLIIILAGTLNILREQTQRRIDKELIGQEIIRSEGEGHDYAEDRDWDSFLTHGGMPSQLDAFDWKRLTGAGDDYQRLHRGIEALELRGVQPGRRFNDPVNLHQSPARLIIMKKIPSVLKKLNADLKRLSTHLEEVPALIIDDESDQASVNTRKPNSQEEKQRTATNKEIVRLLGCLPRAQYIGYTATPFANVFIDPSDAEDLFPKDYIISLPRPIGYMGVSDFFDFADDGGVLTDDERPAGFKSNEEAFIRDVYGEDDGEQNLPKAIDLFIISGAIKLYREKHGVDISCRHHTMLVHRSVKQSDHEQDAELVRALYDQAEIGRKKFYKRLENSWKKDFKAVSEMQAPDAIMPESFTDLKPHIDKCVSLIESEGQPVRIVNGDKKYEDQLPNFDRDRVWSILVGGTKLSRGYTVEGLTVSYYRRRIKTADTLMQVGRWFGFRRGFRDLVRLFLGREEPDGRNRTMDLYEAFKAICRDEEQFRKELQKYSDKSIQPRIRPVQVPPLVPSHMLKPTSRNKMYNTEVKNQNFACEWKERVLPTDKPAGREANAGLARHLLATHQLQGTYRLGYWNIKTGKEVAWDAFIAEISPASMMHFLREYQWMEGKKLIHREIEFIQGSGDKDPQIDRWLAVFPQLARAGDHFWQTQERLSVFRRARSGSGGFNVFSEERHRLVAGYLAGVTNLEGVTPATAELRVGKTAVMVVYPVVGKDDTLEERSDGVSDKEITIGFGLQFPDNNIRVPITFGVIDPRRADAVTIDVQG